MKILGYVPGTEITITQADLDACDRWVRHYENKQLMYLAEAKNLTGVKKSSKYAHAGKAAKAAERWRKNLRAQKEWIGHNE